ncbi:MAG TPA: isochorismatase, partial [Desulfomicrobium sp.]|nr:isochorismatase [Desulfomicrobium sp.]
RIGEFLARARAAGMPVVHSLTSKGTPDTILPQALPLPGEPIVQSTVDKFFRTDLEAILEKLGVHTVIVTGTTAEGAVLHTATGASMRGLNVVVPVDGMSAATLYAEQYTAWHMVNAPGTRARASLTTLDAITINAK